MTSDAFLGRWLTASGIMLAAGAAGYVLARLRARRRWADVRRRRLNSR